jgi:uncharacterized membrane protein
MDIYDSDKMLPLTTVTKLGMKTNMAATLCYVPLFFVNFIAPAVWLASEPKNNYFLRFHSTQALVFGVSYIAVSVSLFAASTVCFFIPVLGHLMMGLFGIIGWLFLLGFLGMNGFLMYASYNNRLVKLPLLGDIADRVLVKLEGR